MRKTGWRVPLALAIGALGLGAWAQEKKGEDVEGKVRQAAFHYYYGNVFGDADEYMQAARFPLYVVRNGVGKPRDEAGARALLAKIAATMKASKLTDEDRKRIGSNLLGVIGDASVQFLGADTATIAFLVKRGANEKEGDSLGEMVLHRRDGRWQVIEEITDSAPVPPEYLKQ